MSPELLAELHRVAGTPTHKEEVINMMTMAGGSPKEIERIFKDYLGLNDQTTAYSEGHNDGQIMLARKVMQDLGQVYELPDGFVELDTADNVARAF